MQPAAQQAKNLVNNLLLTQGQEYSKKILEGLTAGTSHFHAVEYIMNECKTAGFELIKETDKWNLEAGKSYYFTRNGSTVIAFHVGTKA